MKQNTFRLFLIIALSLFIHDGLYSQTIYVGPWDPIEYSPSGSGGNWCLQDAGEDGTTNNPWASWQEAWEAAVSNNTNNQTIQFNPDAFVGSHDYDGVDGDESAGGCQVGAVFDVTSALNGLTIAGNPNGCGTLLDLSTGSGVTKWITVSGVDGLTVRDFYFKSWGQIMDATNSSNILFEDCVIDDCDNFADAIALNACQNVTFRRCTFVGNVFNSSDAVSINGNSGTLADPILFEDCIFTCNEDSDKGSAMIIETGANFVKLDGCVFGGNNTNAAGKGGALYIGVGNTVDIENSNFMDNDGTSATSNDAGGAVYVDANSSTTATEVNFLNSNFYQNLGNTIYGGAIGIRGNSTDPTMAVVNINGCTFEKNGATRGGAIYINYADVSIDESYFEANQNTGLSGANTAGGAIYIQNGNALDSYTLTNSTFTGNLSSDGADINTAANISAGNISTVAANITGTGIVSGATLIDDFDRASSNTVGNGWSEVESGAGFASITSGDYLKLDDQAPAYVHKATAGYDNILTNNTDIISWFFTTSWGTTLDGNFTSGSDNWANVIATDNTNLQSMGNGYAVVGSFPSGNVALVRYTGGLQGTLTSITSQSSSSSAGSVMVRVDYDPSDDTWDLNTSTYSSNQFTNLDGDPRTLTAGADNATDATYTGGALPNMGFYWQGSSTSSSRNAQLNNLYYATPTFGTGWTGTFTSLAGTAPSYDCASFCAMEIPGSCLAANLPEPTNFACASAASTSSLSGQAWEDINGNGIQEVGDNGIMNVYVLLYDSNGYLVGSTTTDAAGNYTFNNIPPDNYTVGFTTPIGGSYTSVSPMDASGSTESTDSDINVSTTNNNGTLGGGYTNPVTVPANTNITDVDAGFNTTIGSIAGIVFNDSNNDGLSDTESNIPSVNVTLFNCGPNGICGDFDDREVNSMVTDGTGNYSFPNIPVNTDYYVEFDNTDGTATNYTYTSQLNAGNYTAATNDSDASPVNGRTPNISLTNAIPDVTNIDAGLTTDIGSLAGNAFQDMNDDGDNEGGTDPAVSNITVILYYTDGTEAGRTITDGSGNYSFPELPYNTYYVGFSNNDGVDVYTYTTQLNPADYSASTNDNDANVTTGNTPNITLNGVTPNITDINVGFNSTTTPLPVELIGFSVKNDDCNAELSWSTATEENTSHFTIQKSINGKPFIDLINITAVGNSTEVNTYTHIDNKPANNTIYRLKIVDWDESFEYSDLVVFRNKNCNNYTTINSVYPNPTKANLNLLLTSSSQKDLILRLIDVSGRVLSEKSIILVEGNNEIILKTNELSEGVYFLNIFDNSGLGEMQTIRFVKF